jgi:hypothetical protein
MERAELELMSIDDLWALHEAVSSMLVEKLAAKKKIVEQRLAELKPIIRPSVQRRRHRLLPTAVGRENRVVKTPGADLTPIEPAIVRPAAGPAQEPAIADAVNSELGWQRFHLRNIGPAGGVCTPGRLFGLDLDQGCQHIAAMTKTDDPDLDPDLDLDELTPKQRERLRKLEQLMREQGYVRHAGGFWISPGSAPQLQPGDDGDD